MAGANGMKGTGSNTIRSKIKTYLRERRQAGFQLKASGLYLLHIPAHMHSCRSCAAADACCRRISIIQGGAAIVGSPYFA
jgi:hypothetical protein